MSYETQVTGEIQIIPPIPWKYIRDSVFLPDAAGKNPARDLVFVINERRAHCDEGLLLIRDAVAVTARFPNYAGNIIKHLQELVDAFPEHQFTGRLDMAGEDAGDLWRLNVVDRVATEHRPKLVWPKESEL